MDLVNLLNKVDTQLLNILCSVPGGWVDFPVPDPDVTAVMLLVKNGMAKLTVEYTVDASLKRPSFFLGVPTGYTTYSGRLNVLITIYGNQTESQQRKIQRLIEKEIPDEWKRNFIGQPRHRFEPDCFMLTTMGHNARQQILNGMPLPLLSYVHRDGAECPFPEVDPFTEHSVFESSDCSEAEGTGRTEQTTSGQRDPPSARSAVANAAVHVTISHPEKPDGQAAQPATTAKPFRGILSYGDRVYQIGENRHVYVSESEDNVLRAFLKQPAMDEETLKRLSKEESAVTVFKRIAEKRDGFVEFMSAPGGKDGGGYQVYIKSVKYNPTDS